MLTQLTFHLRERKVVEELKQHNQHLSKAALREKYQNMSVSPYRFYQNTNHLFWHDFYNDWRLSLFGGVEHTQTWLQGNTHVYNFGAFPSRDGKPAFGMDEFDDAIVGDYQYDLWSLGVSIVLNCGANSFFGFDQASNAVRVMAKAYWKTLMTHALKKSLVLSKSPKLSPYLKTFLKNSIKKKNITAFYDTWVRLSAEGENIFNPQNRLLEPLNKKDKTLFLAIFSDYQRDAWHNHSELKHYQVLDVAHRQYMGNPIDDVDHYFVLVGNAQGALKILDLKEQHLPAACQYMTDDELKRYRQIFPNEGYRHEQAFCAISNHSDPFIGWLEFHGRLYSIRERSPLHQAFSTQHLTLYKDYVSVAKSWGAILAYEHLRGARALLGNEAMPFAQAFAVVAENRAPFLDMVQDISESYANCVVNDYEVFLNEFASHYV
jgi:hypothetical protein